MIVVRVELHSARTGEVTELARMHISNIAVASASGVRFDYLAEVFRGRSKQRLDKLSRNRITTVQNWPRDALHVWNLVSVALRQMGYRATGYGSD
jgi:hypothetical protein